MHLTVRDNKRNEGRGFAQITSQTDGKTREIKKIHRGGKRRKVAGKREDNRGTRELSFHGSPVNYWPYNQPVPCTI